MTLCWSEGELRAYLDGELPSRDMGRVAGHLRECAACRTSCEELSARSQRLEFLLAALPEPEGVIAIPAPPLRQPAGWVWGAATAAAACLAIAVTLAPKYTAARMAARPVPPAPAAAARQPPPVQPAIVRREVPKRAPAPKRKPRIDYYVALDDEPIETGLVLRVGLNDGQIPADVIVGPDGRARAIRLVSDVSGDAK